MIQMNDPLEPDDVELVEVGLADWAVTHGGSITRPTDVISAQFSLGYSVALRIVRRSNDVGLYMNPDLWTDPALLAVIEKVKPYPMPVAPGEELGARVTVTTRDGRRLEAVQPAFRGHHTNPASSGDIEEKFFETVAPVMSQTRSEELVDAIRHVDEMHDVSALVALLVPKTP
jgi:2-methylcitrate dehydratase PrpD